MFRAVLVACLVLLAVPAFAQAPVKNPTVVEFDSPDHEHPQVNAYEMDIVVKATGAVVQTLTISKASVTPVDGTTPQRYRASVNVQPIDFGLYESVVRTVAGAVQSGPSAKSNEWERSPGPPSRPSLR